MPTVVSHWFLLVGDENHPHRNVLFVEECLQIAARNILISSFKNKTRKASK